MQNFRALGALPQTPVPPAAGGFAPKPPAPGCWVLRPQTPIGLHGWGLRLQTPRTAPPPLQISNYAPAGSGNILKSIKQKMYFFIVIRQVKPYRDRFLVSAAI